MSQPATSLRKPPRLSKSRFISGRQCELKLWYDCYQRDLAAQPDEALQAIFAAGHEVGELAQQRWPGGVPVEGEHWDVDRALEQTDALLRDSSVPAIYEAAILHRGVLTRVDVLVRNEDGSWDLVEVKSSARVKEPYDTDVAVQYWILHGAGLKVRRAGVLTLNRDYVYPGGELDLQQLFRFHDLTEGCRARLGEMEQGVVRFQAMLAEPEPPAISIGEHCHTPYECPYWDHCTRDMIFPEQPIELLPGLTGARRDGLVAAGASELADIPDGYSLTVMQKRVLQSTLDNQPWVSRGLRAALEEVQWPLHFLDFEAAPLAIPQQPGMRPFDPLPFQFSCHHQDAEGGSLRHSEFLATDQDDPREPLARALLAALGERGSIIVYSSYEARTIGLLAEALPHYAVPLHALRERLVDLLAIIRKHFYHPDFRGSFSIKAVLPALVESFSYADLMVADGRAAANVWRQLVISDDPALRARLDRALREYCEMDSLAMVRVREALLAFC